MQEYQLSSDKEQFLSDKMEQYNAIYQVGCILSL